MPSNGEKKNHETINLNVKILVHVDPIVRQNAAIDGPLL